MLSWLLPFRSALVLLSFCLLLKLFALDGNRVEMLYSRMLYPAIGNGARRLFGRLPFSVGDLLYAIAVIGIIAALIYSFYFLRHGILPWKVFANGLATTILGLFLIFQLVWGLNYSRQSAAVEAGITLDIYSNDDVMRLAVALQLKLNGLAGQVQQFNFNKYDQLSMLKTEGIAAYANIENRYPLFSYQSASIKNSMYSGIGKYFGFTGYYNPFSGEAQIKSSIPPFLKPFVLLHEMAHQVGYAKEMEANFTAYLVGKESKHAAFKYSVYFEMWLYVLNEVQRRLGPKSVHQLTAHSHPLIIQHRKELKEYLVRNKNKVEPYITFFYDKFLKFNRQPQGMQSYNAVVGWLVAYQKKFGSASF